MVRVTSYETALPSPLMDSSSDDKSSAAPPGPRSVIKNSPARSASWAALRKNLHARAERRRPDSARAATEYDEQRRQRRRQLLRGCTGGAASTNTTRMGRRPDGARAANEYDEQRRRPEGDNFSAAPQVAPRQQTTTCRDPRDARTPRRRDDGNVMATRRQQQASCTGVGFFG